MTVQQILFLVFGAMTLGAAVALVVVRNVFHSALLLLLVFFGVAGLYVLLEAPFFAAAQLFIYMGAIGILIIFAIMLTQGVMRRQAPQLNEQWWMAAILAVALLATVIWVVAQLGGWTTTTAVVPENNLELMGQILVAPEGFALPFEVASVLLIAALIGAVTIVRER